jgi:uncharacterized protein
VPQVFVDTAAWIALCNKSDALHDPALRVMGALRQQNPGLVTTEFILLEVADALAAPPLRPHTVAYLDGLRILPGLVIFSATSQLLVAGLELYRQRPDKEWGLTDCTSFVVMTQEQMTHAFTSDHHFEQAGFIKLL